MKKRIQSWIVAQILFDEKTFFFLTNKKQFPFPRNPLIPAFFLVGRNGNNIRRVLGSLSRDHATINIPLNLTYTPLSQFNHPPWVAL